jgi:surface protein
MNQQNFIHRLFSTLLFAVLLFGSSSTQAQNFITKWTYPSPNSEIKFNALTTGGSVNYTWSASPSNLSGTGSFTQSTPGEVTLSVPNIPAEDIVTLSMTPTNLRRFYIENGPHQSNLVDVTQWGSVAWSSMESAFWGCENLTILATDVPNLTNVTNMSYMFSDATNFNQPIGNWNTANVTNMEGMFGSATKFDQSIGNWNTANVTNMFGMFSRTNFNQSIVDWKTGNVTNMSFMFEDAQKFNQPIVGWNTAKVTDMRAMFAYATNFNQPISNWNTTNVTDMSYMFYDATNFNYPIGWNTAKVGNMSYMFYEATNFNQPIGNWNTSNVFNMSYMFYGATKFNQFLGNWSLKSISNPIFFESLDWMLSNSGMDCNNYSSTLIRWRTNNPLVIGLKLGAHGLKYGTNAVSARNALIANQGWTISGDLPSGFNCAVTTCCPSGGLATPPQTWNIFDISETHQQVDERTTAKSSENLGSSQPNIKVYPNPASPSTTIHVVVAGVELSLEATLCIRDFQGRVVHQQVISNQTDLQLNLLPAGIYIVEAIDGKTILREKVVLTK